MIALRRVKQGYHPTNLKGLTDSVLPELIALRDKHLHDNALIKWNPHLRAPLYPRV